MALSGLERGDGGAFFYRGTGGTFFRKCHRLPGSFIAVFSGAVFFGAAGGRWSIPKRIPRGEVPSPPRPGRFLAGFPGERLAKCSTVAPGGEVMERRKCHRGHGRAECWALTPPNSGTIPTLMWRRWHFSYRFSIDFLDFLYF